MKFKIIVGICILVVLIGCTQFDKEFTECVNQKLLDLEEGNYPTGTNINQFKGDCCEKLGRQPIENMGGEMVSCMNIS